MDRRRFLAGAAGGVAAVALGVRPEGLVSAQAAPSVPPGFTRLRITEGNITLDGMTARAYRIQQDDGTLGYVGTKGQRFRAVVENATSDPLSLHWHGLILPNGQDGVPYVTQPPIRPGERRQYDFPLLQAGTYWMHSHFGLQEQAMMTAPLILRDPHPPVDEQDVVVVINDFTTRDAAAVLAELQGQGGRRPGGGGTRGAGGMGSGDMRRGGVGTGETGMGGGKMVGGKMAMAGPDLTDVRYDALLANRRLLSDPDVVRVPPGRTVRLRLINMASASNVLVGTGALRAEAIAVDGEDVAPLAGTSFELAIAQRLDLRIRLPRRPAAAYPILVQGEGTDLRAGIVLATPDAAVTTLTPRASSAAGALTNRQEARLRAARPLPARPVDRRVRIALGGDMARYVWTLNGQAWPRISPLLVRQGERVEVAFVNETGMAHPMHLHGHVFQVTEIDGAPLPGARRDTVLVMPRQTIKAQFDAQYPGYWMIHCHVLYHQAAGMMTVLRYEGFEDRSYDPLASLAEFRR